MAPSGVLRLALGRTEDGVRFGLAECWRRNRGRSTEEDETELRRSIRATDAVLVSGHRLLVAIAGDETACRLAADRLGRMGWEVRPLEEPYVDDMAAAAGLVVSGQVALGRRLDPRSRGGRGGGRLLLLVEDDPEMRHFLRDLLEKEGWEVVSAASGDAAFRAWTERTPDLMVVDYYLPDTNGAELCLLARRSGCEFPVLICSGAVTSEMVREAERAGVGVVSKLHRLYLTAGLAALVAP
ncbi:MAG TPA: response regulator [Acidimicrobiales bacterium]|nr:response regulator [Acidimicrobiales bacterium]